MSDIDTSRPDGRGEDARGGSPTAPKALVGLHGKVPSYGDFLTRALPGGFVKSWDDWLKRALAEARQSLGPDFLDVYLKAPVWRYVLGPGVAGPEPWCGVLLASTDKVGRCYPLTLAMKLPPLVDTASLMRVWSTGFDGLEEIGLSLLDESLRIDDAVAALHKLAADRPLPAHPLPTTWPANGQAEAWLLPVDRLGPELVHHLVSGSIGPVSLWWHGGLVGAGSSAGSPASLLARGLPPAGGFASMIGGDWRAGGWSGPEAGRTGADA